MPDVYLNTQSMTSACLGIPKAMQKKAMTDTSQRGSLSQKREVVRIYFPSLEYKYKSA